VQKGRASRTAEYMALFRALEHARPTGQRRCEDPLAQAFLTPGLAAVAKLARIPGVAGLLGAFVDRRWPGTRTSAVARTRWIDDALRAALADAPEQLVILGAGFDSRAWRLPELSALRVFEVDHPDTQARKRQALARAGVGVPAHVRFVATDFDQQGLERAMAEAGYDPARRTVFVWEGVSNYLTPAAVDATLRWCAAAAPGSRVIFTYIHADVLTNPQGFFGTDSVMAALSDAGERWTFGLQPSQLAGFLGQRGLRLQSDVGAAEYREQVYGDAARAMRGYEFYRIAVACS
jgi:methyltransferase (TIGR00027 family)